MILRILIVFCLVLAFVLLVSRVLVTASDELGPGEFLLYNDAKIRYQQMGTGRDLVLIHGAPGSADEFRPVVELLAQNFRVTTYDRSGYGRSGFLPGASLQSNRDLLTHLVKVLGLKNPIFAGHSYGGSILAGMSFASDASLIVWSSPFSTYKFDDELKSFQKLLAIPLLKYPITLVTAWFFAPRLISDGMKKNFPPKYHYLADQLSADRVKSWSQPKSILTFASEAGQYEKELGSVRAFSGVKVLGIVGSDEMASIQTDILSLKNLSSKVTLEHWQGHGHNLHLEDPQRFVASVLRFVGRY